MHKASRGHRSCVLTRGTTSRMKREILGRASVELVLLVLLLLGNSGIVTGAFPNAAASKGKVRATLAVAPRGGVTPARALKENGGQRETLARASEEVPGKSQWLQHTWQRQLQQPRMRPEGERRPFGAIGEAVAGLQKRRDKSKQQQQQQHRDNRTLSHTSTLSIVRNTSQTRVQRRALLLVDRPGKKQQGGKGKGKEGERKIDKAEEEEMGEEAGPWYVAESGMKRAGPSAEEAEKKELLPEPRSAVEREGTGRSKDRAGKSKHPADKVVKAKSGTRKGVMKTLVSKVVGKSKGARRIEEVKGVRKSEGTKGAGNLVNSTAAAKTGKSKAAANIVESKGAAKIEESKGAANIEESKGSAKSGERKGSSKVGESKGSDKVGERKGAAKVGESKGAVKVGESKGTAKVGESKGSDKVGESKGAAKVGEIKGSAKVGERKGSAKVGESKGSDKVGERKGAAKVGERKGAAKIGESKGAAKVGESKGAAKVGEIKGSAKVGERKGSGKVGESKGSDKVGERKGAAKIEESKGAAKVGEIKGSAKVGERKGSGKVGESKGSDKVGERKGAAKVGERKGAAKIGESKGAAKVGESKGSDKVGESKGAAKIGESKGAAKVGESKGSAKVGESKGSDKVGERKGSAKVGESKGAAKTEKSTAAVKTGKSKAVAKTGKFNGSSLGKSGETKGSSRVSRDKGAKKSGVAKVQKEAKLLSAGAPTSYSLRLRLPKWWTSEVEAPEDLLKDVLMHDVPSDSSTPKDEARRALKVKSLPGRALEGHDVRVGKNGREPRRRLLKDSSQTGKRHTVTVQKAKSQDHNGNCVHGHDQDSHHAVEGMVVKSPGEKTMTGDSRKRSAEFKTVKPKETRLKIRDLTGPITTSRNTRKPRASGKVHAVALIQRHQAASGEQAAVLTRPRVAGGQFLAGRVSHKVKFLGPQRVEHGVFVFPTSVNLRRSLAARLPKHTALHVQGHA